MTHSHIHNDVLSPDTQAILLLCGSLGKPRAGEAPLTLSEYNRLAQWLKERQLRPADLLTTDVLRESEQDAALLPFGERVRMLLGRGAALALAVEGWTNQQLWVVSRSDPHYPKLLKTRLGRLAPPLFYGVGNHDLLDQGGLAMVGSRDIDEHGVAFTRALAAKCAEQEMQIVSGGARGVDREAMQATLEAGGCVVGVLADSLARAALDGRYRPFLIDQRLVLISPYDPRAGFNVGNAMSRNKCIYGLSDFALVVSATLEKGGTWNGAIENLKNGWVPLFVRNDPHLSGNQRLIARGGFPIDSAVLNPDVRLAAWLRSHAPSANATLPLDAVDDTWPDAAHPLSNHAMASTGAPVQEPPESRPDSTATESGTDLFPVVWPHIARALATPRSDQDIADLFHIEVKQARNWLSRAVEDGRVKKLTKPVRYILTDCSPQTQMF